MKSEKGMCDESNHFEQKYVLNTGFNPPVNDLKSDETSVKRLLFIESGFKFGTASKICDQFL